MSFIHHDRKKIEKKCDQVYHTEGMDIANKLLMTCLLPKYQNAIGLAHNQIGGTKAVFIAKLSTDPTSDYGGASRKWRAFVNPSIVSKSTELEESSEGCMTFPNKENKVMRHTWVEVEHQVKPRHLGVAFTKERFEGFDAVIVQHEIDHLNGYHIHNQEEK